MADVGASYVTQDDWEKLTDRCCEVRFRIMTHDELRQGVLMYVFTVLGEKGLKENLDEIETSLREEQFSEKLINIMKEARRQRIDYVRFDLDGGEVINLKPAIE